MNCLLYTRKILLPVCFTANLLIASVCDAQNIKSKISPITFSLVKSTQSFEPMLTNKVALNDLDGDNDLDLVCSNFGFNNSQIWINDGKGYFVDSGQKLLQSSHGVAIGDINKDRTPDILFAGGKFSTNDQVYSSPSKIYINDGKARFADSGQSFSDSLKSCTNVNLIDIDNDGDLDAALNFYDREKNLPNRIFHNDGNGTFKKSDTIFPSNSIWGDFNSDGFIDVFSRISGIGYQSILNDTKGNLAVADTIRDTSVVSGSSATADIDNDGDLDVLITNGNRRKKYPTKVLLNDGSGKFSASSIELSSVMFGKIGLGDLNGDSFVDAVIIGVGEPISVWLNDGKGNFYDSEIRLDYSGRITGIQFGDLDNDKDLDIVVANFKGGSNEIYFNVKH